MHKKMHHHKKHHGPQVKASTVTIKLPASEAGHARSISFWGGRFPYGMRRFGSGCLRRRIKTAIAKAIHHAHAQKSREAQLE